MIYLRGLLHHISARRPDLLERHGMLCLQAAARHVAMETLRLRGSLTLTGINNASWTSGAFRESYLRPTATQLLGLVLEGLDTDAESKTYDLHRVQGAFLKNSTTGIIQNLFPVPLPNLRAEAQKLMGSASPAVNPQFWADAQGAVVIWPWFDQTLGWDTLTLLLAVVPSQQDFEYIPLPNETEEAIIEEAIGRAYAYAGRGFSEELHKEHKASADYKIAGLRVADAIGSSGRPGQRSQFGFSLR